MKNRFYNFSILKIGQVLFTLVVLALCPLTMYGQNTVYLSEDFTSNSAPTDWVLDSAGTNVSSGSCQDNSRIFSFDCSEYPASSAGGTPSGFDQNVAVIDLDNVGGAASSSDSLYCIVTDTVNTTGSGGLDLKFDWEHESFATTGTFRVEVWDGSAWQQVFSQGADGSGADTVDISSYSNANLRVRFCFSTEGSTSSSIWGSAVDNIEIFEIACPKPTNLSINSIATDSVNFSWKTGDSSQLKYQAILGGAGTDTLISNDTSATFKGLMSSSNYTLQVKEICSTNDTSEISNTLSFNTLCNTFTASYYNGFDSASAKSPIPIGEFCWFTAGNQKSQINLASGTSGNNTDPPVSKPNKVTFNDADLTAGDTSLLISPAFTDLSQHDKRIRFQAAFEDTADSRLFVGVMDNPLNTSSITLIDTLEARNDQPDGTWQEFIVNLNDSSLVDTAEHIFIANGDGTWESSIDNFNYETIPSCLKPINLSLSNLGVDSATINWNTQDNGSTWNVNYDTGTFKNGNGGNTITVNDSSATLNGLSSNQSYQVNVRQVCQNGDTSFYSVALKFTTLCNPFTAFYQEQFDSQPAISPFGDRGFCWSTLGNESDQINLAANNSGNNTDTPPSRPNKITFNDAAFTNGDTSLFISPQFTDLDKADKQITVQVAFEDLTNSRLFFGVMNNETKASTFTITDTLTPKSNQTAGEFQQFTLPLNDTSVVDTQEYVAFANGDGTWESSIDNIVYEEIPPCPAPDRITVTSRTDTSASLKWRSNGNGSSWVVSYDTAGFTPGTGQIKGGVPDTLTTLTGLQPNTLYEAYPREICQSGDTGNLKNAVTFITACDTPSRVGLPYKEGFENFQGSHLDYKQFCSRSMANWTFSSDDKTGRLRFSGAGLSASTGLKAATMDKSSGSGQIANDLILTLNMNNYSVSDPYVLTFDHREYQDAGDSNDSLWVRGSQQDSWIGLYNLDSTSSNQFSKVGPLNISNVLSQQNQNFSASFQVRFGQEGKNSTNGRVTDGRAFDKIKIGQPDLAVTSFPEPKGRCGLSRDDSISVSIRNTGLDTVKSGSKLQVGYQFDTTTYAPQQIKLSSSLSPGDSVVRKLKRSFNLSGADTMYQVKAWVKWDSDIKGSNDTGSSTIQIRNPNLRVDRIIDTSAEVQWANTASANATQVIYGQKGFSPAQGGGSRITSSTTSRMIGGLQKATSYEVYIREICKNGDTGSLRGPVAFKTRDAANDLLAYQISKPRERCGLTSNEPVALTLVNFGFDTIPANTSITVTYKLNNNQPVQKNFQLNNLLGPSDTVRQPFSQTVDLSQQGRNYNFKAWVKWSADQNGKNDTVKKSLYASNVPAKPISTGDTICEGNQATLKAGGNAQRFNWYADTTGTLLLQNTSTFNFKPTRDSVVYVRAFNDPDSCKSPYAKVKAAVKEAPQVSFSSDTACANNSVSLSGQAQLNQGTIQQFEWKLGDGRSLTGQDIQTTYPSSGIYPVTLTAISNEGCDGSSQNPLKVKASPVADFASDTLCYTPTISIKEQVEANGTTIQQYQWSLGNGQNAKGQTVSGSYASPGNYNVSLNVEAANNCKDTVTQALSLLPVPEAQFSVDEKCEGEPVPFTNQSIPNGASSLQYQWSFDDGQGSTKPNPDHTYNIYGNQDVRLVTFYDSLGKICRDTAQQTINIGQAVEATFQVKKQGKGKVVFIPDNAAADKYLWDFGNGDTAQIASPEYSYRSTGTYTVTLQTVTDKGCGRVDSQQVNIEAVGLENNPNANKVRVFPNPLGSGKSIKVMFTRSQKGVSSMKLVNMTGQVVQQKQTFHHSGRSHQVLMPIPSDTKAGVYMLKVSIGDRVYKEKIVITPR